MGELEGASLPPHRGGRGGASSFVLRRRRELNPVRGPRGAILRLFARVRLPRPFRPQGAPPALAGGRRAQIMNNLIIKALYVTAGMPPRGGGKGAMLKNNENMKTLTEYIYAWRLFWKARPLATLAGPGRARNNPCFLCIFCQSVFKELPKVAAAHLQGAVVLEPRKLAHHLLL